MMSTPSIPEPAKPAGLDAQQLDTHQQTRPLPWWIGRRWFALTWCVSQPLNYVATKKSSGGGGKGGGKGGGGSTTTATCDVAGLVACGQADFIEAIEVNGDIVWSAAGGISRGVAHPEHTGNIVVPNVGTFRLHWGTETAAGDWLILGPEHPWYRGQIVLEAKSLNAGSSQSLPNIRVLLERAPIVAGLDGDRSREGANPITGVAEILENSFYGLGQAGVIHAASAATLANTLRDRTKVLAVPGDPTHTAHMGYISAYIADRQSFGSFLAGVLENFDGWARRNGEQLELGHWTHDGTVPPGLAELSLHDMVDDPEFANPAPDDSEVISEAIVTGLDRDWQMGDGWEAAHNHATRDRLGERRAKTFSRPFLCTRYQLKEQANELVSFYAWPAKRSTTRWRRAKVGALQPGDRFIDNYSPSASRQVYRILRRSDPARGGVVELEIEPERGLAPLTYVAASDPAPALPTPELPVVVAAARMFQVPVWWAGSPAPTVIPLVSRPAAHVLGFRVHFSADDASYDLQAESVDWAVHGTLVSGIAGGDAAAVLALTSFDLALLIEQTTAAQLDDALLLFIGSEVMSIGTVTALGSGQYGLSLLRARRGTAAAAHAGGVDCYILPRAECLLLAHADFPRAIATRYFKLPTYTVRDSQALADALKLTFNFADTGVDAPQSLVAFGGPGTITVRFTNPPAGDLATLEVWERSAAAPAPVDGDTPDFTEPLAPDGGPGKFVRSGLAGTVTRYYWLRNRDTIAGKSTIEGPVYATTTVDPDAADAAVRALIEATNRDLAQWMLLNQDHVTHLHQEIAKRAAGINGVTAALTTETTDRIAADAAEVTNRTAALAALSASLYAAIADEQAASVTRDEANARDLAYVIATLGDQTAVVLQEKSARKTATDALSTLITALSATVDANNASATATLSAHATTLAAHSTSLTSLNSNVAGLHTSVDVLAAAYITPAGQAVAMAGWNLNAGGQAVSLTLITATGPVTVSALVLAGCDMLTSNYAQDGSGVPTLGWKLTYGGILKAVSAILRSADIIGTLRVGSTIEGGVIADAPFPTYTDPGTPNIRINAPGSPPSGYYIRYQVGTGSWLTASSFPFTVTMPNTTTLLNVQPFATGRTSPGIESNSWNTLFL